jgi:transposase
VLVHERVKYACRTCQEQVAVAAKPPQPVAKGLPGPGLLAHTVLAKYGDHAPLYRQEDVHARHGIILRRSTLCDWIAAAADLAEPLYRRMRQLVLQSRIIWTDDTTVKLLDPLLGRARTARFWAYLGDPQQPYSVYDFTDSRNRDGPQSFLQGYRGYLQADAYGGYDGIYAGGHVVEVACWAHARRKWYEARSSDPPRAHQALALIQRLYDVEEDCRPLERELRCAVRQERSLPLLAEFRAWLDADCAGALPKSPIGQAAVYARNQWQALTRYCEDGELSIDNNAAERAMKIPALGRKAWLFVASRAGGRRAAILFSLVASCKANQVEPWAYLRDVFSRLPALANASTEELDPLLPDRWLRDHPQHRWVIDDLRRRARRPAKSRRGK